MSIGEATNSLLLLEGANTKADSSDKLAEAVMVVTGGSDCTLRGFVSSELFRIVVVVSTR